VLTSFFLAHLFGPSLMGFQQVLLAEMIWVSGKTEY